MKVLKHLFDNNRSWAEKIIETDPDFFSTLSKQQKPDYLWIGCSDSRVPANQVIDLLPGEIFVHRNIANLVIHTDLSCLSVIQFAVDVLKVKHIIVCGHYGCGGIKAAMDNNQHGLIDNWLRHVKDVYRIHEDKFDLYLSDNEKHQLLCELNVVEQVNNICHTTIVQNAWDAGQELTVHGWVYNLEIGLLKDLNACISSKEEERNKFHTKEIIDSFK
ncbi:carbonate dehydratase [Candidatus Scalindua japonica]|uniref:Carbonic anhydrase n=1 Tax=Candidatus Scalindua japonica TaxID=1284222 RepID=A0A286U067_9BACT|nr:carbonate dehydratase [Candidatus Scalindua japonica]GAX61530.1 carbonate dehydratase [Candidatus Scalindua japonica]